MLLRLAAALLLTPAALAQPADTLRLDVVEAMRLALAESPEVAIEEAGVAFAAARAQQASAARFFTEARITTGHALAPGIARNGATLPADALYLDPRVRNDWENTRPYNEAEVEILQPIFTWGQLGGTIRAAEAGVAVEAADVQAKTAEVALRTGEAFTGLQLAEALARLADETGRALGTAREELERLLDEGDPTVDDADLFQLRLFEQEYRRQRVEVDERRALAASALGRLLLRPGAPVVAEPLGPLPFEAQPLEAYQAIALQRRPELAKAAAGVRAREALVEVARSDYFPKLFLGGSFRGRYAAGRVQQGNPYVSDSYLGAGLRFGLGIRQELTFLQTRAKVEQARAQLAEVRFQREAAGQLALFEVEEAYRNLTIAQAALETRREALQITGEWLRGEQINFDLGLGETADLIAAVRADLEARAAHLQAVHAYNVAVLRLLARTGTLAERLASGTLFEPAPGD